MTLLQESTESELLARVPIGLFIDGSWREASHRETFEIRDPSTGRALCVVADAAAEDGQQALDAACNAQEAWAASAPRARSEILRNAFDELIRHKEDLALLMTLEMGKPLAESRDEVVYGAEFLRWFSEEAVRISGRYGPNPEGSGTMVVSRHPVGPCYLITPWNFPLAMATRKIAPALAAGCAVVVKPAEATPLTTLFLTSLLQVAGVPAGVVNVVPTSKPGRVSQPILADSRLRKLSFTGSTTVGRRLLAQSAEHVLRVSMELGGNAPFLVFDDADLDRAVDGALAAKFRNIGEACTAANRFLVQDSVAEDFGRRIAERVRGMKVGRGTEEDVQIGPLINDDAVSKVVSLVDDAARRGATVRTGGRRRETGGGSFFEPTVLSGVAPGSAILDTEIFGPVVAITSFHDEDEAVRLANDTVYGLVAYVYTEDLSRAHRLIDRLESGMVGINTGVVSNAAAPFGGIKQSGIGREGGLEGIEEYLVTKYTLIPTHREREVS